MKRLPQLSLAMIAAACCCGSALSAPMAIITATKPSETSKVGFSDVDAAIGAGIEECVRYIRLPDRYSFPANGQPYVAGDEQTRSFFAKHGFKTEADVPEDIRLFFNKPTAFGKPFVYVEFQSPEVTVWMMGQEAFPKCGLVIKGIHQAYEVNRRLIAKLISSDWKDLRPMASPKPPLWDTILVKTLGGDKDPNYGVRIKIRALDDTWRSETGAGFPANYFFLTMDLIAGTISTGSANQRSGQ